MADTVTKKERSRIMAKIKSKNTRVEMTFRKQLRTNEIRYRLNYALEGKPDIVIPSKKLAIFIDGCFWHGCAKHFRMPKSNKAYWRSKIERNMARDKAVKKTLKSKGWKVMRIWEHEIKNSSERAAKRVKRVLNPFKSI
ncbi:MAG: very short patch repair endonuclease [Nanoarchaeota archaeon]|nr:very short patch repair endonuclease [Nanoarchaeota archaeon]MBU4451803.1 very short patch repair endonuclease [Nanoarchaeota archaeon]MCG2723468.1 very short patch repair endonuclease [archaeon]